MRGHGTWRMGDAFVAQRRRRAYRRERGLTLIELLVTIAVAGVLLGVAMPHDSRARFNLPNAQTTLLGDLRKTRTDSLTKGDHFELEMTSATSYTIYRMRLQGNNWIRNGAVLTRSLPANVSFGSLGGPFQFDTRGLLVSPPTTTTIALNDSRTGHTKYVRVWLSGQVTNQ